MEYSNLPIFDSNSSLIAARRTAYMAYCEVCCFVINGTNPSLYSVAIRLPRLFAIPANLRHLSAFSICLQNMERFAFLAFVAAASSSCNDIVIANVHL